MRRSFFFLVFALLFVVAGCADGFAPRGDDDGEKYDEGAAPSPLLTPEADAETAAPGTQPTAPVAPTMTPVPTATAMPQPTATSTPVPTATPTPTPTATATPTPTPTPMFPPEVLAAPVRGIIGDTTVQAVASDIDGTIATVQVLDAPTGVTVTADNELRYIPQDAETRSVQVLVTDSQGLSTAGDVTLIGRFRGHPQALVALGDSVPSGHGLDFEDYLGSDPCWRAPNSYPRRAFNALNAQGIFPPGQGEFALLACSGYDVDDLFEREVTGGFSDITPASGKRTQLEWTILTNPRFVTITIGANDTGFVGPAQLFLEDGVTLDQPQVDRRMAVIDQDLRFVIDELIAKTDATIFVSNYYDPTAENPQGIPTCRLECFRSASENVVGRMNDVIEEVARSYNERRVHFVDFETPFIGKGAPNGLGPDGFREGGFGIIGDLLAGQVEDVHPYCARGATVGASWVSPIDCVHPDERGTEELGKIMAAAISEVVANEAANAADPFVPAPVEGP